MWKAQSEIVQSGLKIQLLRNHSVLSFRDYFESLESDTGFAAWYTETLAKCEFQAFYWEHPSLTTANFDKEAEFVLIDAPSLARLHPDPAPFEAEFRNSSDEDVVTFPNLGGDALLIVPRPVGPLVAYSHLADFVRGGPMDQVCSLWRHTAKAICEDLSSTPSWLSTAGLGVAWLHLRIDTRPKYYSYAPYKVVE